MRVARASLRVLRQPPSFTDSAFIRGLGVGLEHAPLETKIALPDNPANDMEVFVIEIRK